MSRSFKHKPFSAICGGSSAQYDKTLAARGVRRAHRQVMHIALHTGEYDVILPHRLQCSHNEIYSWSRDGHQNYCGLSSKDWQRYIEATTYVQNWNAIERWNKRHYSTWPPTWFKEMMRK
jgi:hypothetical protein